MSTATNEKNPSDRESKGLQTAIERGSRLPRRPENLKLLCTLDLIDKGAL